MSQGLKDSHQSGPERTVPAVVAAGRVHRPVNQKGAPHDGTAVYESPVAAVLAVVAIVAHGEIFSGWNYDLVTLNVFMDFRPPLGNDIGRNHLAPDWREGIVEWIDGRQRIMHGVRLIQEFGIDIDVPVDDLHVVARQSNDTLDEMLVVCERILENDNVAALQLPVRKDLFIPGAGAAENKFVYQQVIADQQGAFHRGRGNFEGLHDEAGSKQGQDDRHQERLQVFGNRGLIFAMSLLFFRRQLFD